MKCLFCDKEILETDLAWWGMDGDPIHKECVPKMERSMGDISQSKEALENFLGYKSVMEQ